MQDNERTCWETIQHSVSSYIEQPHAGSYNHIFHLVYISFILVPVASYVLATTELSEDQRFVLQFVDRLFHILFTIEFQTSCFTILAHKNSTVEEFLLNRRLDCRHRRLS